MSRDQLQAGQLDKAAESALQGAKIEEVLVASSPTNTNAQNTLALLYSQLGQSEKELKDWPAAKGAYQKSLAIYQDMKGKGTLAAPDATKPDELTREIARCEDALK